MPYNYAHGEPQLRSHSRGQNGNGSNESAKSKGSKPISQKAMLSRALQKANSAVQLDNSQSFQEARRAYAEACELLQHVLQRTSADEDKRKLEAIQRTYTSRIEELDQMSLWQDAAPTPSSKALPSRPDSRGYRRGSVLHLDDDDDEQEDDDPFGNYHLHRGQDGMYARQPMVNSRPMMDPSRNPPQTKPPPPPPQQLRQTYGQQHQFRDRSQDAFRPLQPSPNRDPPGLLQSSFSRSPVRLRSPGALQPPEPRESMFMPRPLTPRRPSSPSKIPIGVSNDAAMRSGSSLAAEPRLEQERRPSAHTRDESQNSWLDPIDESGGSTASSVHSRTSSLGYRRKHIRAASGNTEAEFDTALDAAIEAAYDEGYEPAEMSDTDIRAPEDDAVANAMRKVAIARERVRRTEQEAYELQQRQMQQQKQQFGDFYDDGNSSDEEERMLKEMTRGYSIDEFAMSQHQRQIQQHRPPLESRGSIPRESDSSGLTNRTWQSSTSTNPMTGSSSLSTVAEALPATKPLAPSGPPPTQILPELPLPPRPLSSQAQGVRSRRLSGQNAKQLMIETAIPGASSTSAQRIEDVSRSRSAASDHYEAAADHEGLRMRSSRQRHRSPSPHTDMISPESQLQEAPVLHSARADHDETQAMAGRAASPSTHKLRKNFSSSSLKSMKSRNASLSNLDEGSDMSPGTPSSSQFASSRVPAMPALPTPLATSFRDRMDASAGTGGLYLFDDNFHSPTTPGSPNALSLDAPVPLEPCPTDLMLRPFWLMRCLFQTLVHPRGGYVSTKLFVPRDVWRVKGVKLKNVEEKIANCDLLTAALLKLAKVDTFDADAVLEEMQSLEGILEQTQMALARKLGNEVGLNGIGTFFKDATSMNSDVDGQAGPPRSASVSGKSSSFSWRRLRSKNSAVSLGSAGTGRSGSAATDRDTPMPTLPMTPNPTLRPAKRDISSAQFIGPNANYMNALARLFDAAQAIDQIARQVEDPGLRHADKTQVGLELCTRHAAEFFGFYICRFVLADLGMLLDKFIKRGSEWVLS